MRNDFLSEKWRTGPPRITRVAISIVFVAAYIVGTRTWYNKVTNGTWEEMDVFRNISLVTDETDTQGLKRRCKSCLGGQWDIVWKCMEVAYCSKVCKTKDWTKALHGSCSNLYHVSRFN